MRSGRPTNHAVVNAVPTAKTQRIGRHRPTARAGIVTDASTSPRNSPRIGAGYRLINVGSVALPITSAGSSPAASDASSSTRPASAPWRSSAAEAPGPGNPSGSRKPWPTRRQNAPPAALRSKAGPNPLTASTSRA